MGSDFSSESAGAQDTCPENNWPYVWAIRDPEILDWKQSGRGTSLTKAEIAALAETQVFYWFPTRAF